MERSKSTWCHAPGKSVTKLVIDHVYTGNDMTSFHLVLQQLLTHQHVASQMPFIPNTMLLVLPGIKHARLPVQQEIIEISFIFIN